MTVVTVVRGGAWALSDDDAAVKLRAGDVAVFRGPDHYTVADTPQRPVRRRRPIRMGWSPVP